MVGITRSKVIFTVLFFWTFFGMLYVQYVCASLGILNGCSPIFSRVPVFRPPATAEHHMAGGVLTCFDMFWLPSPTCSMVLEYLPIYIWTIFGVNVGVHIPAPWSIRVSGYTDFFFVFDPMEFVNLFPSPICSMYGIFTNICPRNHPNVGKYTIHGAYGSWSPHCLGHRLVAEINMATFRRARRKLTRRPGMTWDGSSVPMTDPAGAGLLPSGYVKIAIEHGHWFREFSHEQMVDLSVVM